MAYGLSQFSRRCVVASVFTIVAGIFTGCSQPTAIVPKAETPASTVVSQELNSSDAASKGEKVIPVKSQDAPMSAEKLLSVIPQDKWPQPGPDGASAREAANAWLSKHVVGQSVEVSFKVHDVQLTGGDQNNTLNITPTAMGPNSVEERLSAVVSVGKAEAGKYLCHIQVTGPEPTWRNVPNSQMEKYEGLKGKLIKFRGKIASAQFMSEDAQRLDCILELSELVPDFGLLAQGNNNPTTPPEGDTQENTGKRTEEARQLAAAKKALQQMPKPLQASELAAQPVLTAGMDQLLPPDKAFPLRRVVGPVVNGKPHGEFRGYAPNRQLMFVQQVQEDKRQGLLRTFYPGGRPFGIWNFVNDEIDGPIYLFYQSGQLRSFTTWKKGVQDGPTALYFDSGKLALLNEMKQGKAEGLRFHYLPSGPLYAITRWENDQQVAQEDLGGVNSNFLSIDSLGNIEAQMNKLGHQFKECWTSKPPPSFKPLRNGHKIGEWKSLFNGKDLGGWWPLLNPELKNTNPLDQLAAWEVKEGILQGTPQKASSYLLFDECFANFHLRAEVRIDDKTNASITFGMPHIVTHYHSGHNFVQIATKHEYLFTGAVYPSGQASNRTKNTLLHKPGDWFTLEVIAQGKHIVTKVNGTTAVDVTMLRDKYDPLGHLGIVLRRVPPPPVRGRRAGDEPIDPTAKVEFRKLEIMPLSDE